jgi:cytosine/uracil/thiamine/allantoin permease
VAFLIGVACLLAALMVGVIYNIQNFGDFQAVQFWRVQWLLGAVAAFAGGILLKRQGKS